MSVRQFTQHRADGVSRRRVLVCAMIIVLPVILLAGAWRLGGVSALEDDLIFYLPIRQYIADCIRDGEFPLWNPHVAMGTSIAADPQSGLWYPPTYIFLLLPALVAYPLTIVLHFALAGGGMYRFLRACRHDWRAALLGAIAFEFCGYLIAHRAHLTIHQAVAWLPWMLYTWRRFAEKGSYRYFALASVAFGLQMLVQHVQISLICVTLLTGYVAVVLWPRRRSLVWQYPTGMAVGIMLSGVQLIPTWLHYANSIRGSASFHLFVENSWLPSSSLMMLFPMLFGARTPNLWSQPWWCWSHFCEQCVYASILVLILAGASLALLRQTKSRREVIFWWVASLVALVIALGRFTPISELLFHVPIYRSLRVPARWMLVWSVALPVLASMTVSAILRDDEFTDRIARTVRRLVTRILPVVVGLCLLLMAIVRWRVDQLSAYFQRRPNLELWEGIRSAIRPGNPAIWWPIVLMLATGWIVVRWARNRRSASFALMFLVLLIDLTMVASTVDVDTRTYQRSDLCEKPPLAAAIQKLEPRPGDRLLVPRSSANYDRPLEVLWPQTNLRPGISTFNSYGPLQSVSHRLLFRFQPWGSSEEMLALLRNPALCRAMGIRFLAVRSAQERDLLAQAQLPAVEPEPELTVIPQSQVSDFVVVYAGDDLLWPVRVEREGVYVFTFFAKPGGSPSSRCFIRLETVDGDPISDTRSIEPADMALGMRRMQFIFYCWQAPGAAQIRIKSERRDALVIGKAEFGLLAAVTDRNRVEKGQNSLAKSGPAPQFIHRADLPGDVSLYEIPDASESVRWAKAVEKVPNLLEAVDRLHDQPIESGMPKGVVLEWPENVGEPPIGGSGPIVYDWPTGHELKIQTNAPADGLLIFNQSYDPGWQATVNGEQVSIIRVNAVTQGVVVPAGDCRAVFRYLPCGLRTAIPMSLVAILLLFSGSAVACWKCLGRKQA